MAQMIRVSTYKRVPVALSVEPPLPLSCGEVYYDMPGGLLKQALAYLRLLQRKFMIASGSMTLYSYLQQIFYRTCLAWPGLLAMARISCCNENVDHDIVS